MPEFFKWYRRHMIIYYAITLSEAVAMARIKQQKGATMKFNEVCRIECLALPLLI